MILSDIAEATRVEAESFSKHQWHNIAALATTAIPGRLPGHPAPAARPGAFVPTFCHRDTETREESLIDDLRLTNSWFARFVFTALGIGRTKAVLEEPSAGRLAAERGSQAGEAEPVDGTFAGSLWQTSG